MFLRNVALCSNVRLEVSMFNPNDLNGNVGENCAQQIPLVIGIVYRKKNAKGPKITGCLGLDSLATGAPAVRCSGPPLVHL